MSFREGRARCDWREECTNPVTHIGAKGYVYCTPCAPNRHGYESVRKMRTWEIRLIESDKPLRSYRAITKAEHDELENMK